MRLTTAVQRLLNTSDVLAEVAQERERQDERWGEQNHVLTIWNGILVEEVGEVAKAVNDHVFGGKPVSEIRDELIQVAAVAVAWVEFIDRRGF